MSVALTYYLTHKNPHYNTSVFQLSVSYNLFTLLEMTDSLLHLTKLLVTFCTTKINSFKQRLSNSVCLCALSCLSIGLWVWFITAKNPFRVLLSEIKNIQTSILQEYLCFICTWLEVRSNLFRQRFCSIMLKNITKKYFYKQKKLNNTTSLLCWHRLFTGTWMKNIMTATSPLKLEIDLWVSPPSFLLTLSNKYKKYSKEYSYTRLVRATISSLTKSLKLMLKNNTYCLFHSMHSFL